MLRYDTEDNQGGLDDLQKAADIYQKQGQNDDYQEVIKMMRKLKK